jgi:hypothetical protein
VGPAKEQSEDLDSQQLRFARVLPPGKIPFNVDFGVAQVANRILPGVALDARSQFAFGISYKF